MLSATIRGSFHCLREFIVPLGGLVHSSISARRMAPRIIGADRRNRNILGTQLSRDLFLRIKVSFHQLIIPVVPSWHWDRRALFFFEVINNFLINCQPIISMDTITSINRICIDRLGLSIDGAGLG